MAGTRALTEFKKLTLDAKMEFNFVEPVWIGMRVRMRGTVSASRASPHRPPARAHQKLPCRTSRVHTACMLSFA
jgi:hypothetical protein